MNVEDELKKIQREITLLKRENNELRQDINDERRRRVKFMKNVNIMFNEYATMNTRHSNTIKKYIEDENDDITVIPSLENEGFKSDTNSVSTLMERINRMVPAIEAPREVQMIEAPKQPLMIEPPKEILRIEPPKHVIKKEMNLIKMETNLIPFRKNIFPFNDNRMEEY